MCHGFREHIALSFVNRSFLLRNRKRLSYGSYRRKTTCRDLNCQLKKLSYISDYRFINIKYLTWIGMWLLSQEVIDTFIFRNRNGVKLASITTSKTALYSVFIENLSRVTCKVYAISDQAKEETAAVVRKT